MTRDRRPTLGALFVSLALVAQLAGCMSVPEYQRPEAPVPVAWREGEPEEQFVRAAAGG